MKKKINILFLALLVVCSVIGITYAFFTETVDFENNFLVGNFEVVIEEEFDESQYLGADSSIVNKQVYVTNKENTGAIVRLMYDEYIDLSDSLEYKNIVNNLCTDSDCVVKNWTSSFINDWILYDGWYYYKKVLNPAEKIQILSTLSESTTLLSGIYNLDFNIEAVQADSNAVKELWNKIVAIEEDGSLTWTFS